MRTALRWLKRLVLGGVAIVVIAIVVITALVHTDWGRERLRRRVEAALAKAFPGGAHLGRIDGSVLGDLVLRDVELRDADGRPTVTVRAVRLNLGYGALLRGELQLETLILDGVDLHVRAVAGGTPNVATLYRPSPEPGTWDVAIDRLEIRAGAITIDRGAAGVDHLDDVTVTAGVRMAAAGPVAAHGHVAARWRERAGAALVTDVAVAIDAAGVVTVPRAQLSLDRLALTTTGLRYRGPGDLDGQLRVVAPAGELARLAPTAGLPALPVDVLARASVGPDGAIDLRLTGGAGGATVDGTLAVRPTAPAPRVDGTIAVAAVDLARLAPDLPPTELAATIALALAYDPGARGLAAVTGTASVAGRGTVARVALDDLTAKVDARDGAATVVVTGRGPGATEITASGRVREIARGYRLDDGTVTATIASLAAATRGAVPVDGAVDAALAVGGTITGADAHLDARATVHGRRLVGGGGRARAVDVTVALAGAPGTLAGDARVVASGLAWGGLALPAIIATARGPLDGRAPVAVQLDARDRARATTAAVTATVVRVGVGADAQTRIALGRYQVATPAAEVAGAGGEVVVGTTQVAVRGVRARGAGGELSLDGALGLVPGVVARSGTVEITGLDLARLRGLPGVPTTARGLISGRVEVQQRGRTITGEVAVTGQGVVVAAGARPVELAVTAEAGRGTVAVALDARGPDVGALTLAATVRPRGRLDDLAAWRRLERTDVRAARVDADALDLAALARLVGQTAPVSGTIATTITAGPDRADLAIHGRGLEVAGAPAPLDLDVVVALDPAAPGQLAVDATLRGLGAAHLTSAVRVPARPLDLAAWRALDASAVDALTMTLDEITVDGALARALGLGRARGIVAATVSATAGLRAVEARVDARDLIAGPLVAPVTATVVARADDRGLEATADVGLRGRPLVTVTARAPTALPALLAGTTALAAVPIAGSIALVEGDIATLARALGEPIDVTGRIAGTGALAGAVGAPVATAALVVTDLGARATGAGRRARGGIRRLDVDLRYRPGAVHGEINGRQDDGGTLDVTADLDPAMLASARASIRARGFQLGPLARLAPTTLLGVRGVLDADLQLRGGALDRALLVGVAKVTGGQVPLADTIGNLRGATIDATFAAGSARLAVAGAVESGRVEAVATAQLGGLVPRTAAIEVGVRSLRMITTAAPTITGDVRIHLDLTRPRWTAKARVRGAEVTLPARGGRALHPAGVPLDLVFTTDTAVTAPLPLTRSTVLRTWLGTRPTVPVLDLGVTIEPVAVVSSTFRGDVGGALQLTVGVDGAAVDGTVKVDRGTVAVFDRRYAIRRAALVFDGSIDPLLDIELEYQFPQLALRVAVDQRYSEPRLTLTSVPSTYTEGQLLAIALGGSPTDPGNETYDAATGLLTAAASSFIAGFVGGVLPIRFDVLNYEPGTATSGGAFVVGRWLTDQLLVLFRSRVDARVDQNVNEAEAEYWLRRDLLLEGTAGDRALGLDLLWNRRW